MHDNGKQALTLGPILTWLPLLAAIMGQLTMNMTVFLGHTHTSESISTNGTTGLGVVFFNLSLVLYLPLWVLVLVLYHSERSVVIAANSWSLVDEERKSVVPTESRMGYIYPDDYTLRNRRYIRSSAQTRTGDDSEKITAYWNTKCVACDGCGSGCKSLTTGINRLGISTVGNLNMHELIAIVNTIAYAAIVCFPVDEYEAVHLTAAAIYFVTLYFHLCLAIWSPALTDYKGYEGVKLLRIFVFACATLTGFGLFLGLVAVEWFFPVYEVTGSVCVSMYIALFSVEFHNVFDSMDISVRRKRDRDLRTDARGTVDPPQPPAAGDQTEPAKDDAELEVRGGNEGVSSHSPALILKF